ncbi:MgtC/SapB family protein [Bacillus sp. FJAT-42376]|uniref:MgtC/SapB family protein n=1 Tax=Bacillus sp. FJAT-42376 TaxID=2014076 RepID=UPI000F50146D|nr:MgtC/SapB family protein [Bacillus sp. FJAT-42376]AZB44627.1 MgtC/SapB family protein [Bacillus sp. FJAT-42376]
MEEAIVESIHLDVLLKLSCAAIAGIIIGLERELKGKPLGLKTCLIVSVTACLLTVVSYESSFLYAEAYTRPMDPGRIPSYVLSGIGFLGAGVILRRSNEVISGLTTAALVFASAAIGISIGAGFYFEALAGVIFIFLGVRIIPLALGKVGIKRLKQKEFKVKIYAEKNTDLTNLLQFLREKGLGTKRVRIKEEPASIVVYCSVISEAENCPTAIFYEIRKQPGVLQADVENME